MSVHSQYKDLFDVAGDIYKKAIILPNWEHGSGSNKLLCLLAYRYNKY